MTESASVSQDNNEAILDIPPAKDETPKTPKTNGNHSEETENAGEGPPTKKRRVSETAPNPRRKPESPPWKRVVAEGPTSFTQDGKRKSGRVNQIPLELQPPSDKRQTRGAIQKTYSAKSKHANTNGSLHVRDAPTVLTNGYKRPASSHATSSQTLQKSPSKPTISPKRSYRKSMPSEQTSTLVRSYKSSSASKAPHTASTQAHLDTRRRSGRGSDIAQDGRTGPIPQEMENASSNSPATKLSRIKLRVKPASLPFIHPGLALQRPKLYPTLDDYFDSANIIPVADGGLCGVEDGPDYTDEGVLRDAQLLLRIEEASKPGGLLSPETCSAFEPPEQESIPEQYGHQDHLNRAALEFRRLMLIEQRKHRATAKRIAESCRDEWVRRQPKSQEQLEAEEIKAAENRYKVLIKSLQATWGNVRAEVNRRRLVEWEAQEQARVRKALNEAVDLSTQKLQARTRLDSETPTEEDSGDESQPSLAEDISPPPSQSALEERDSNMSSSESEAEDDHFSLNATEDENLTQDQLREKYAVLPTLSRGNAYDDEALVDDEEMLDVPSYDEGQGSGIDESDQSTDMGDDMGSSDEELESDEDEDSENESENAGETTLLGFLAPSELKSMELESVKPDLEIAGSSGDFDGDELSLVPDVSAKTLPTQADDDHGPSENNSTEDAEIAKQNFERMATSPDRSSQPTPRTTETRQSETDSASSVDPQQSSRQVTQANTPQPEKDSKTPIPSLLRGTLRPYQHDGLDWLAGLYANNTNGILADEMGLGKTIQTIALLAHLADIHQVWGPHLVIVPTSVILNWEMEFKKFLPGFKILTYYGTQEERKRKRAGWKTEDKWNVCITSYQIILKDVQVFKRRRWHYMILDEAHNIKNFKSQRWQAMLTFNTQARLLLTGTPLQNNLTELWSLLFFLMPGDGTEQNEGRFAELGEFSEWFKKPSEVILEHGRDQMDSEAKALIGKLHKVLRPHLLRRLKADVEKQMPGKHEHVEYCRLSKRQRELYDGFLSREDTRGTLTSGNYLSIMNCLMQLRKVCNHPDLFVDRPIMTSFPMEKPAIADFEIKELLVRQQLLKEDPMRRASLEFLNLVPANHERLSGAVTLRSYNLAAQHILMKMRENQRDRAQKALTNLDTSTSKSNLVYLESASRWGRFEELQHCVYLNALRRQQMPIYGKDLLDLLTIGVTERPLKPKPRHRTQMLTWLEDFSSTLSSMRTTLALRAEEMDIKLRIFACVTPAVVARDMISLALTRKGIGTVQPFIDGSSRDPFHEARMRLSIQFPDKRLLQYDCGKLQALAKLLRRLKEKGSRALIFTQMTKVLDILEQFLNIHGHKYLRLDGSTKIEQRQILTDRFNNEEKYLAFILSSRSGGLGINLTGADTVIFYDLDWNPAMDKQCQDRCHRIGQTRDVHIYRLVSEHTIEANILRKANQKQMLDDVVIQEGEFTTDRFNKNSVQDVSLEESSLSDGDAAASAAMDRVLGGPDNSKSVQRALAQVEDREDAVAAKAAEREVVQTDAADFDENAAIASETPADLGTPRDDTDMPDGTLAIDDEMDLDEEDEINAWGGSIGSTDDYMLKCMAAELKDTPVEIPKDRKKGKDSRHRSHRAR